MMSSPVVRAVAAEILKLRRRPAMWVVTACWAAQIVLFAYLVPFLISQAPPGPSTGTAADHRLILVKLFPENLDLTTSSSYPLFGSAVMLILGALLAGTEYRWSTWSIMVTQGPPRATVVLGKFLASAVGVLLVVCVSFLAAAAASSVVAVIKHGPLSGPPIGRLALSLGAALLIGCTWAWVGMFLGILVRGSAVALAGGLVYALGLENAISAVSAMVPALHAVRTVLLGINSGSLVAAVGAADQSTASGTLGVVAVVGGVRALLTVLAYSVASLALSMLVVNRRDVA